MTLGKNFRLPTDIKPKTYDADLRLDLDADRFEGELADRADARRAARRAITVHAVGLEVLRRRVPRSAGSTIAAKPTVDAESETLTLAFAERAAGGETHAAHRLVGARSARACAASTARAASPSRSSRRPTRAACSPASTSRRSRRSGELQLAGVPTEAVAISNGDGRQRRGRRARRRGALDLRARRRRCRRTWSR